MSRPEGNLTTQSPYDVNRPRWRSAGRTTDTVAVTVFRQVQLKTCYIHWIQMPNGGVSEFIKTFQCCDITSYEICTTFSLCHFVVVCCPLLPLNRAISQTPLRSKYPAMHTCAFLLQIGAFCGIWAKRIMRFVRQVYCARIPQGNEKFYEGFISSSRCVIHNIDQQQLIYIYIYIYIYICPDE